MKVIAEYTLWPPQTTVNLPLGADVLSVQQRYADLILICEIEQGANDLENREFIVVDEYGSIPERELQLIDTVMMDGGSKYCVVYEILDSNV